MQHEAERAASAQHGWRALLVWTALVAALSSCSVRELPTSTGRDGACCAGHGTCLPPAFLEAKQSSLLGSETCGESLLCVPNELRSHEPPKTCRVTSTAAEGRCLPGCLPSVLQRGDQLSRETCEEHQRCVPCYDPITGESTQACSADSDVGAQEPPVTFAACCGELGRCVPQGLVPSDQRSALGRDSCGKEGSLCAPLEGLLEGNAYLPASCVTLGFGAEGRCLPACLPPLAAQRERLGQAGCADGHLCAPCFDPVTGKPTGSCALGTDPGASTPQSAPQTCCESLGHCLPSSLLRQDERAQLGSDTCSAMDTMCVPDAFVASDFRPAPCRSSSAGAEGRCLPACLPQLSKQRERLKRDSCAERELCAPCTDPLTGQSTGACELGKDPGPAGPPMVFGECCEGRARCVPEGAVPEQQRAQLARETCAAEAALCVPSEMASTPSFVPTACVVSALHTEGRCLSRCLPAVAARPDVFKQESCSDGQACVPCFDPVTGKESGACGFGSDPGPSQPAALLTQCCEGQGRCAPRSWIAAEQSESFGRDSCARDAELLCVAPGAALSDPGFIPTRCHDDSTGGEGRCLPACLPPVAALAASLSRDVCPAAELCAPCFNPLTGASTGACDSGADPGPAEPPVVFETCCGASPQSATGVCVPASLLPAGAPELPRQSCAASGTVCAPRVLVEDPSAALPGCTSVGTDKGVCIDTCYLSALAQLASFAGDCAAGRLCVACSLLGESMSGCQTEPSE